MILQKRKHPIQFLAENNIKDYNIEFKRIRDTNNTKSMLCSSPKFTECPVSKKKSPMKTAASKKLFAGNSRIAKKIVTTTILQSSGVSASPTNSSQSVTSIEKEQITQSSPDSNQSNCQQPCSQPPSTQTQSISKTINATNQNIVEIDAR